MTAIIFQTFIIARDETQYVLVSQHDGLVNFSLSEPTSLVPR